VGGRGAMGGPDGVGAGVDGGVGYAYFACSGERVASGVGCWVLVWVNRVLKD
jgi:hypothetical protein